MDDLASDGGPATTQRIIVVVNGGTASSAEILAGALRDRRSAVLVGTTTLGKDAVQIPFDLRNGGELHVTIARWSSPNGLDVGTGGWQPDHELELPAGMTVEELVRQVLEATS